MRATVYMFGLEVEGSVEYDPGQPYPTYSCGGVPPSWDIEVEHIELDDPDEFLATGFVADVADDREWSEGALQVIEAGIRLTGKLPPVIETLLLEAWEDDLRDRLAQEHPAA
jgi:hypothetical protein